jgi:diguanylate cyclase (GGDEF)-like protein
MSNYLWELPHDLRTRIAEKLREHQLPLTEDVSLALSGVPGIDAAGGREFSSILINLFSSATEAGGLDQSRGVLHDFCNATGQMQVRNVIHAIHRAERVLLDELALDADIGATAEGWPMTAHTIRSAAFEIAAAYSERDGGRTALRDPLTTLIAEPVFRLALEQEIERANRYGHGLSILLFDVDNLSEVNRSQGFGAGDRLLERLGISARRFFRHHDWVARHRDDAIAVLLPETPLDKAAVLATRFREMVQQRLVLADHKTETAVRVTVSAAAVGTELVQSDIDAGFMIAEAEAAILRAKMEGGNRTEHVALQPTSVTIIGAATLLDTTPREVIRLLRGGALKGARRGRHVHIDRAHLEEFKRARETREL